MVEHKFDLTISQSRLFVAVREFDDEESVWTQANFSQGALIKPDFLMLDPLANEEFSATVILRQSERFSADKRAQRRLQIPLKMTEEAELFIAAVDDEEATGIVLAAGDYTLIYEVCVASDVFYILTLLKQPCESAKALMADAWGLKKDQPLVLDVSAV